MYEIHISDVRTFKSCRRKWNWSSPIRRNLEPNVPYAPFFTGRAIHAALEDYYRLREKDPKIDPGTTLRESVERFIQAERTNMGELWPQELQMVEEQLELIDGMLAHYALWVGQDQGRWNDDNLRFHALETQFRVPIRAKSGRRSTRVYYSGRMDGVVQMIDDGTYWIWETKTTRSIEELKRSLVNDPQAGAYIYAAQELWDIPVSGVLYNMLRKKVPTYPEVLNSGLLTRRANIDTTAYAYLNAITSHHPDWKMDTLLAEYGDIIQTLLDKGNTFFTRYPVRRTPNEIDQLARDLHTVSLEMTSPRVAIYPNETWLNCGFCHFRGPCLAMNSGQDVELLLGNEYRERIQFSLDEAEEGGFTGSGSGSGSKGGTNGNSSRV